MNIQHRSIFDIDKVTKLYTEKDGVPVRYVCASATHAHAAYAEDIYYRETPHPEFGNHYFGLYRNPYSDNAEIMITNADKVESLDFDMIEIDGVLHYSQHRHDFYSVGDVSLDGGRSYLRLVGNVSAYPVKRLVLKNGEFVEKDNEL